MSNEHADADQTSRDPARVVVAFIAEMHEWELASHIACKEALRSSDPASYQVPVSEGLMKVFDKWCMPKDRKYGRLGSFSNPPEYQPQHEKVIQVVIEQPQRASVYTKRERGFMENRMYVLKRKSGRWLIDSVKTQEADGSWSPAGL